MLDLSACSCKAGLLVSLSKDGNVRVWDAAQEACTASYSTEASCMVSNTGELTVRSVVHIVRMICSWFAQHVGMYIVTMPSQLAAPACHACMHVAGDFQQC